MRGHFSALSWKLIKAVLYVFCSFICPEKGKLFGMGDNRENQLGINQRGKSEEPVLQVPFPTRIHFSKAAKPVRVSCGAFHSAALTGQSVDMNFILGALYFPFASLRYIACSPGLGSVCCLCKFTPYEKKTN